MNSPHRKSSAIMLLCGTAMAMALNSPTRIVKEKEAQFYCRDCDNFPEKSFCKTKGIKVTKGTLACKQFKT